jgi:hypothetical protein
MYIFLDESGNFKKHNHEEYFVIASFTVGDQRRTDKSFRSWCHTKFPKRMRSQSEIKWSATGITDELRLRTLKRIAAIDVRIRYGFLQRINIPSTYRNKKDQIDSGALYTSIVGEILEKYLPTDDKEIHIFCDRRPLKGMIKRQFESAIKARLLPYCTPGTLVQVEMIDSTTNGNMQIADWIAGAFARHLEKGRLDEECFRILKNNLLSQGQEFFKQ